MASNDAARAGVAAEAGQGIVATGTRAAPANRAQAREQAPRRGDWNACTVDDPDRNLAACRKIVRRALKGAPAQAQSDLADGLNLAWQGETGEAIAAFDRAIAAAPGSAFAYLNRGMAYRHRGDLERALADLDRAVDHAPAEARVYYNRSLVLRASGAVARARRDEQRAVELDPAYAGLVR